MMTDKGRPEPGKQYALTGAAGKPSIMAGNSWAEAEVPPADQVVTKEDRHFARQEKKENAEAIIQLVDKLGRKSCVQYGRRGGEYTPLVLNDSGVGYHGFISDWTSDCRSEFRYGLIAAGFKQGMYEAPYFWRVSKNGVSVEYVEGDVYVTGI